MTQQPFYPQAPAPQQYAPAPPQAYQPPAQPQYPGYPPQQAYAPAPQQYAPAPAQPLASGTIDDFYNQPSTGGGAALKFEQVGTRYVGIVARPITAGDIQQQTDTQQRPLTFKDGRPKFVMKVPLQMQPSPTYPEGTAQWYVKGAARDELVRAMAEAGAPEGAPEFGAVIDVTFTGTRASGVGMNPAKLFAVRYTRPQGAAPAPATPSPVAGSVAPEQPAPAQQPVQQYAAPAAPPAPLPPAPLAPAQPQYQEQQYQQAPAAPPQVAQAPAPQPPADMSAEQQALLARLTGVQTGQAQA